MARRFPKFTACLAALLAAGLVLLSGCGSTHRTQESQAPQAALDQDLTFFRELLDDAGSKLAVYSVALPQFAEQEGVAAGDINRFYQSELAVLQADCESWFGIVSGKNYSETRTNVFTYRLLDAPEGFVSVERLMTVNGTEGHYFTEFFSLVSGWQRSFADLFNCNVKCETVLRDRVRNWCLEASVPCDNLDGMTLGSLTASFLIDGETLRLYYDHQSLSVQQDQAVVVEIPMEKLEDFLLN